MAVEWSQQKQATFIHPLDDDDVIAGHGTIGLELLKQHPALDVILVPVGEGGLLGGISCAIKRRQAGVQIIGVQTTRLPSMKAALHHGDAVALPTCPTFADGIAVRKPGTRTLPLVRSYVDRIVTVDEDEIAATILTLLEGEKTVAEAAGAVAPSAVVHKKTGHRGKISPCSVRRQPRCQFADENHRTRPGP